MEFPQVRPIGVEEGLSIPEAGAVVAGDAAPYSLCPEIESEGRLRACLRILAKRRWLVFIVSMLVSVTGGVITGMQTPIYRATLRLQIDVGQPDTTSIGRKGSPDVPSLPTEENLKTQCEVLASRTLATRVIRTLKLENDSRILGTSRFAWAGKPAQWVRSAWRAAVAAVTSPQPGSAAGEKEPNFSPLAEAFASCVTAAPVRNSGIVAVSFDSPDAILAADALNTMASEYVQMNFETRYKATIAASQFLARQLIDLQAEVEKSEAELAKFELAHGINAAGEQEDVTLQRPDDPKAPVPPGETAPPNWDVNQHGILKRQVDTRRRVYESMLQRVREVWVSAGTKSGNTHVLDPAEAPKSPRLPNIMANMITALAAGLLSGIALAFFTEYIGSYSNRYLRTPKDVRSAVRLPFLGLIPSEQIQGSQSSRWWLALRARGSRIAAARNGAGGIHTLFDTGGFHGSKGGKGSGIVRADRVIAAVELVTHFDGKSPLSEAYRDLRASILLSASADRSPKSLLFTSSLKGEGKTATCVNLAVTMAQANEKVLLMDCDLRNPNVHRIFGLNNTNGVSTFLSGTSTNSLPLIQFSQEYRLFVFPTGRIPPNAVELIASMRMKKCLVALAQHFDHILIDSPPLLSDVDARILASLVDGVILVIKGTTTKEAVGRSERLLRDAHARILGTMLNNVDPSLSGPNDFSKQYRAAAGHAAKSSDSTGSLRLVR